MKIKVTPAGNFLSIVEAVNDEDEVVSSYDEVTEDEMEQVTQWLKSETYTALDYISEILNDMETSRTLMTAYEHYNLYWYRYSRPSIGKVESIKIESTCDSDGETLVSAFDDAFGVLKYTDSMNNVQGFVEWAGDFEYDMQTAYKIWEAIWNGWEDIQTIFTKEEIALIKHAFEEGRGSI